MRTEIYFCLELTESEHWRVEEELKSLCSQHELELVYYRELKEGHIPMHREVKLRGDINRVKAYIREHKLDKHVVPNPYSE